MILEYILYYQRSYISIFNYIKNNIIIRLLNVIICIYKKEKRYVKYM